ncbi:MAG TPA: HAMP domain-containing sensor histidine kinase [Kofleriaceae bacterium]|nr:HAMP domain-containing sensor histidine kinase [Kofleriaceae bacterium]
MPRDATTGVQSRLIAACSAIALVIVLGTTAAFVALRSMVRHAERGVATSQRLVTIEQLRADARELARSARRYLISGDGKERQRVFAIERQMKLDGAQIRSDEPALDRALDRYTSAVVRAFENPSGDTARALARFEDELARARAPLAEVFETVVGEQQQSDVGRAASTRRFGIVAQAALATATVLALALVFGVGVAVRRGARAHARQRSELDRQQERVATARRRLLGASTELRASLDAIVAHGDRLRLAACADGELQSLQVITIQAAFAERMLRDLISATEIQVGRVALRHELHDLAALIRDASERHAARARARGIRLSADTGTFSRVSVDRERIDYVLNTLLGLAIEAVRPGGEIVLRCERADDRFRVTVADTAVPTPQLAVLEPATSHTSDDLRLELCERLVEAHGGRLGMDASTHGNAFWFTLPTSPTLLR